MRVSLKALLICVTLFAIAFCIIAYETPMSRLEKRGASFGGKTTGDLFLMGYPYQWYDYIDNNAKENRCLLYTSPSPRDRQKSRMPSSA